ncbi:hypothetical protein [Paenarthrobacter nitroguajacolicus]|uniref:hypothetical protein n=1 Tax=Paenarthrobacter nitroguajacolicus TaxID=211146 RepID=UPI00248C9183|nr:hypothetical protein [Paenarthrobacter nitroguajacolicus]MDI2034734.1 hypothetical protein [Paenarthrobacter nitroguajacolicus]
MGKTNAPMTALAITAVVITALTGCGVPPAASPPATTPASPTPTAACPITGTEPQGGNCVQYDGDAAMAANEMYRQRRKLGPEMQALLNQHVAPAKDALEALARPVTADEVKGAFAALDLKEVQTDDGGNGLRFGVSVPSGGCLYGVVPLAGEVSVAAGGSIMDGGCLEMIGH